MNTLYIDTHLFDINIILFHDKVIKNEEHIINQKKNSMYLVPSLKKVIENEDIDEIIVVNGPGSFTGTRLGVTIAKTLAYVKKIPIKVINYFEVMKCQIKEMNYILGINDGNGYFLAEYKNKELIKQPYYLNNKDIDNNMDIITNISIDYNNVLNYAEKIEYTNPHLVNPIYIKLIGVENDK